MTACGLSVAQCYTLEAIGSQGRSSLNAVAEALYITPSTASRAVDDLVRKGLVERRQDPADRRAIRLSLTPRGRALFDALRQHLIQRQLTILQQLDPDSRRDVLVALHKLVQAVKDPACCAVPLVWQGEAPASRRLGQQTPGESTARRGSRRRHPTASAR
jgi:DNA-binding MarR family transcriptional regulator